MTHGKTSVEMSTCPLIFSFQFKFLTLNIICIGLLDLTHNTVTRNKELTQQLLPRE